MEEARNMGTRSHTNGAFLLIIGVVVGLLLAGLVLPIRSGSGRVIGPVNASQGGALVGGGETAGPVGGSGSVAASGAGGAATNAAGGRGRAGAGAAGAGAGAGRALAATGSSARGVTDNAVRIGITVPDVGSIKFLGPAVDNGDGQQQMAAVLDRWKREGLVPVNGRDVVFVYRKHGVSSPEESRAACIGFVQEDKVFAVGSNITFPGGNDCLAREFKTPLVTNEMMTDGQLQRGAPFMFSEETSINRLLRSWVHWAHKGGLLKDKKIGLLYYTGNPTPDNETFAADVKAELAKLQYKLTSEGTLDGSQSAISVAVQRFRTDGVNLVMPVINSIDQITFIQNADAQAYRPTYIDSDFQFNTADILSQSKHDGTLAMSTLRYGEQNAAMGLSPVGKACMDNYQRYSGKSVQSKSSEENYTLSGCDLGAVLIKALQLAGRDLNQQSFIRALEGIRALPMGYHGPYASFYPNRHHGTEVQRTLQYRTACPTVNPNGAGCWVAMGDFSPLSVP